MSSVVRVHQLVSGSKRDRESINDPGIVSVDRISALPKDLILQILSLLPTKDAIATSLLSKQWKSLWKKLPKLKFSYNPCRGHKLKTFSKNFHKTLLSCEAQFLQSLHLSIKLYSCSRMEIGVLIEIAIACNVRKLELKLAGGYRLEFPKSLYNCEILETLELKYMDLIDVPSSVCLKFLRTLRLYHVDFKEDESCLRLLSGCPNLENLVCGFSNSEFRKFVINAHSLKYLELYTSGKPWWNFLTLMLDSSPKLQVLKLMIDVSTK